MRSDILVVVVGQQSNQPNEKYVITDYYGQNIISGCGGTFVTRRKHEVTGPMTPPTVSDVLLVVAGGAGSGPAKAFSHARVTEYANGNDIIGTAGRSAYKQCYSGGSGYNGDVEKEWYDNYERQKPVTDGKLTGGLFEAKEPFFLLVVHYFFPYMDTYRRLIPSFLWQQ